MPLDDRQQQLCDDSPFDFSGLTALFINCTLKPSPEQSHTEGLASIATAVMEANGVTVDMVRAVDLDLPPGVQPDMTQHGAASDGWPALYDKVMAADILVLMTPIWLGESRCAPESSSGSTARQRCSTTPASTPITGGSVAALSPATRTAPSTAP